MMKPENKRLSGKAAKKAAIIPVVAVVAVMLLLYPENCMDSARYGLDLWLRTVVPSLFPFMAASFLLLETGIVRLAAFIFAPLTRALFAAPGESAYVFFASAMSGYPVGARLTGELYASGQLGEDDARRIVRFTSVSGPVFLTGAVSTGMLGVPEAGAYLAAAHYLAALLTGVFFGVLARRKPTAARPPGTRWSDAAGRFRRDVAACPPAGDMLSAGVDKALMTLFKIGGYIILFSVVIEMLFVTGVIDAAQFLYAPLAGLFGLGAPATQALLTGGVELAAGCARVAALDMALDQKLVLISGMAAFGGLCVHLQTSAVLAGCGLKHKRLLLAKSLHGVLAGALTALLLALFPLASAASGFQSKTAAYGGVIFAAAALAALALVKLWQRRMRRSVLPLAH